jgi:hypothetical protein
MLAVLAPTSSAKCGEGCCRFNPGFRVAQSRGYLRVVPTARRRHNGVQHLCISVRQTRHFRLSNAHLIKHRPPFDFDAVQEETKQRILCRFHRTVLVMLVLAQEEKILQFTSVDTGWLISLGRRKRERWLAQLNQDMQHDIRNPRIILTIRILLTITALMTLSGSLMGMYGTFAFSFKNGTSLW